MPFHPHKEAAALDLGVEGAPLQAYQQALHSEAELKRVLATIQHVRSSIYHTLDQVRCCLCCCWVAHACMHRLHLTQRLPCMSPRQKPMQQVALG
jgi:hypothetical protein